MIVGVDTGKTVAVSCISLSGASIYSAHMKSGGIPWLVSTIEKVGIPSVIASDKNFRGETIHKINSAFNSILFMPKGNIPMIEKRQLAHEKSIKDPHERDAYIAAIKAYNYYANKLKQAEHIAKQKNIKDVDLVLAKVIKKYSISEAINNKEAKRLSDKNLWG